MKTHQVVLSKALKDVPTVQVTEGCTVFTVELGALAIVDEVTLCLQTETYDSLSVSVKRIQNEEWRAVSVEETSNFDQKDLNFCRKQFTTQFVAKYLRFEVHGFELNDSETKQASESKPQRPKHRRRRNLSLSLNSSNNNSSTASSLVVLGYEIDLSTLRMQFASARAVAMFNFSHRIMSNADVDSTAHSLDLLDAKFLAAMSLAANRTLQQAQELFQQLRGQLRSARAALLKTDADYEWKDRCYMFREAQLYLVMAYNIADDGRDAEKLQLIESAADLLHQLSCPGEQPSLSDTVCHLLTLALVSSDQMYTGRDESLFPTLAPMCRIALKLILFLVNCVRCDMEHGFTLAMYFIVHFYAAKALVEDSPSSSPSSFAFISEGCHRLLMHMSHTVSHAHPCRVLSMSVPKWWTAQPSELREHQQDGSCLNDCMRILTACIELLPSFSPMIVQDVATFTIDLLLQLMPLEGALSPPPSSKAGNDQGIPALSWQESSLDQLRGALLQTATTALLCARQHIGPILHGCEHRKAFEEGAVLSLAFKACRSSAIAVRRNAAMFLHVLFDIIPGACHHSCPTNNEAAQYYPRVAVWIARQLDSFVVDYKAERQSDIDKLVALPEAPQPDARPGAKRKPKLPRLDSLATGENSMMPYTDTVLILLLRLCRRVVQSRAEAQIDDAVSPPDSAHMMLVQSLVDCATAVQVGVTLNSAIHSNLVDILHLCGKHWPLAFANVTPQLAPNCGGNIYVTSELHRLAGLWTNTPLTPKFIQIVTALLKRFTVCHQQHEMCANAVLEDVMVAYCQRLPDSLVPAVFDPLHETFCKLTKQVSEPLLQALVNALTHALIPRSEAYHKFRAVFLHSVVSLPCPAAQELVQQLQPPKSKPKRKSPLSTPESKSPAQRAARIAARTKSQGKRRRKKKKKKKGQGKAKNTTTDESVRDPERLQANGTHSPSREESVPPKPVAKRGALFTVLNECVEILKRKIDSPLLSTTKTKHLRSQQDAALGLLLETLSVLLQSVYCADDEDEAEDATSCILFHAPASFDHSDNGTHQLRTVLVDMQPQMMGLLTASDEDTFSIQTEHRVKLARYLLQLCEHPCSSVPETFVASLNTELQSTGNECRTSVLVNCLLGSLSAVSFFLRKHKAKLGSNHASQAFDMLLNVLQPGLASSWLACQELSAALCWSVSTWVADILHAQALPASWSMTRLVDMIGGVSPGVASSTALAFVGEATEVLLKERAYELKEPVVSRLSAMRVRIMAQRRSVDRTGISSSHIALTQCVCNLLERVLSSRPSALMASSPPHYISLLRGLTVTPLYEALSSPLSESDSEEPTQSFHKYVTALYSNCLPRKQKDESRCLLDADPFDSGGREGFSNVFHRWQTGDFLQRSEDGTGTPKASYANEQTAVPDTVASDPPSTTGAVKDNTSKQDQVAALDDSERFLFEELGIIDLDALGSEETDIERAFAMEQKASGRSAPDPVEPLPSIAEIEAEELVTELTAVESPPAISDVDAFALSQEELMEQATKELVLEERAAVQRPASASHRYRRDDSERLSDFLDENEDCVVIDDSSSSDEGCDDEVIVREESDEPATRGLVCVDNPVEASSENEANSIEADLVVLNVEDVDPFIRRESSDSAEDPDLPPGVIVESDDSASDMPVQANPPDKPRQHASVKHHHATSDFVAPFSHHPTPTPTPSLPHGHSEGDFLRLRTPLAASRPGRLGSIEEHAASPDFPGSEYDAPEAEVRYSEKRFRVPRSQSSFSKLLVRPLRSAPSRSQSLDQLRQGSKVEHVTHLCNYLLNDTTADPVLRDKLRHLAQRKRRQLDLDAQRQWVMDSAAGGYGRAPSRRRPPTFPSRRGSKSEWNRTEEEWLAHRHADRH